MTASEVSDIVAIAEMTPGPIGLNCATFAGMRVAGILGSLISALGVLMPTFTICAVAAVFFQKFKDSRILKNIMVGVRPAALGIIFAVMITLSRTNYLVAGAVSFKAVAVGLIAFFLLTYSSSWLISAGRYTLSALPLFLLEGDWLQRHEKLKFPILLLSSMLMMLYFVGYFSWKQIM